MLGRSLLVAFGCILLSSYTVALNNGLALTPPMGWLSWERFRCNIDCKNEPDDCISERLFQTMADLLASEGYAKVGYEYIIIDDCWLAKERSSAGLLQPDLKRFPKGMKALAKHIHMKGLKFGIYEDFGSETCAHYPGILGPTMEIDAKTFASWDVDYVKLDGCNSLPKDMDKGYPEFGKYMNQTGRRMIYSCSWPFYQTYSNMKPNFASIIEHCNLWRNYLDIQDSWASVAGIIDYFGNNQNDIIPLAGPGHFNDPDMLIIGNYGLSYEQSKTQMSIWAILAAPLLMSVDLRTIRSEYKAILQNKEVIAVNQDPLAIQGRRLLKNYQIPGMEIWVRPITPMYKNEYSYAIVFFNNRTDGLPKLVSFNLTAFNITASTGYKVKDLYSDVRYDCLDSNTTVTVKVNPTGVVMLKAEVLDEKTYSMCVKGNHATSAQFNIYLATTSLVVIFLAGVM